MGNSLAEPENPQPGIRREQPLQPISRPQQPQPQPEYGPSPPPPRPSPPVSPSHQTLTCEICVEPIDPPTQLFQPKNKNCGPHAFCNNCVAKYIQAKLDENISKIPCPALHCSKFLDPHDCSRFITPQLFIRWCDSLCDSAVQGTEKRYCPNRNCSALVLNECGDVNVTMATCPNCKSAFCFQCKRPWHAGFRCGELRDQNNRNFIVLAEQNKWTSCPKCHQYVERISGCDHIICRCQTRFCYKCGKELQSLVCSHCTTRGQRCWYYCWTCVGVTFVLGGASGLICFILWLICSLFLKWIKW